MHKKRPKICTSCWVSAVHSGAIYQISVQWIHFSCYSDSTEGKTGNCTTALCSSKIAKVRPHSAEWPEGTSVQSSGPWLSPPHHKCAPTIFFYIPASLGSTVRVRKNLSKYQFFDRLCVKDIAFQGKYMVIWCDGSFSHRTVMDKHVSQHIIYI